MKFNYDFFKDSILALANMRSIRERGFYAKVKGVSANSFPEAKSPHFNISSENTLATPQYMID